MMEIISSPVVFLALFSFFAIGAIGSLLAWKNDVFANRWSSVFAAIGSLSGIIFSVSTVISGKEIFFSVGRSSFPLMAITFQIDRLAAFFIFVISLIAFFCSIYGASYAKHFYNKYHLGHLGFFYNLNLAGLLLVVTAAHALFFIIAWELMSITSYFLVSYDRNDKNNARAGLLYLVLTYIGTVFIMLAFLLLHRYTGSFDFAVIKSNLALVPPLVKNAIFIFALIGFGTKAGVIPLHIWLPSAHPAAPSHVSALMSGVMIKTGIYMMIRLFLDIFQPIPLWWGVTVLIIGLVSALLGVLYALTEHDLKRLLAYHSIENIGIILLGLGSAMIFYSLGLPTLALLGLTAAMFHTLNHAIFKSLLFLCAGSVINQTHTGNMEEYGGLIRRMPQTALFFLVGSMAISALPPFNGFFSEWLTFQALFQGIIQLPYSLQSVFILAAGSLAFTGGLALACFVKAFGITFLARARSSEAEQARESALTMRIAMGGLALLAVLFGLFSGTAIVWLEKISHGLVIFKDVKSFVSVSREQSIVVGAGFASVSAPVIFVSFLLAMIAVAFIVGRLINRKQTVKSGATWDCGVDLSPRMEITATGFARSIILVFKGLLKPSIQKEISYRDSDSRYLPTMRLVRMGIKDVYQTYLYAPLGNFASAISQRVKSIQSGSINAYISYILIALVVALFSVL